MLLSQVRRKAELSSDVHALGVFVVKHEIHCDANVTARRRVLLQDAPSLFSEIFRIGKPSVSARHAGGSLLWLSTQHGRFEHPNASLVA